MSEPSGSDGEEFPYNVRDPGSIPGLERSLEEGNGYQLQFSWSFPVAREILGWESEKRDEGL